MLLFCYASRGINGIDKYDDHSAFDAIMIYYFIFHEFGERFIFLRYYRRINFLAISKDLGTVVNCFT